MSNLIFSKANVFYIDPVLVDGSVTAGVSSIDLYFQGKPSATNNSSGVNYPGISVYISYLDVNGNPDSNNVILDNFARVEYNSVNISNNCTVATNFKFPKPVTLNTGSSYAFLIQYDGNDEFNIFEAQQGQYIISNNQLYSGSAGKYVGASFDYSSPSASNSNGAWNPSTGADIVFQIYFAKYYGDISSNGINQVSYVVTPDSYEFFTYDRINSKNTQNIYPGEYAYQVKEFNTSIISVQANSNLITGYNLNWNTLYNNSSNNFIIIYSGNTVNIRQIQSIVSNTVLSLNLPPNVTNSAANFMVSPVGQVYIVDSSRFSGFYQDLLILNNSNANTTLKFTNNNIISANIIMSGNNYSNTDYITVYGGGINEANVPSPALFGVVTNGNGNIVQLNLFHQGYGFFTTPLYNILNANNVTSNGSGASIQFNIGSAIRTETSNAYFSNTILVPFSLSGAAIISDLSNPSGVSTQINENFLYYTLNDGIYISDIISGGNAYLNTDTVVFTSNTGNGAYATITTDSTGTIVKLNIIEPGNSYATPPVITITSNTGSGANISSALGLGTVYENSSYLKINVQSGIGLGLNYSNTVVFMPKSLELSENTVNYTTATGITTAKNSSSVIEWDITCNNYFLSPDAQTSNADVYFWKYIINNDYTNENTGSGSAYSKDITNVITLANNTLAEDLIVYLDALKPAQTDLKVFAKIYNSQDSEPFDEKDWTLLQDTTPANTISSTSVTEFSYGLNTYPNTAFTFSGTATTTSNSTAIVGFNSNYNSLSNGSLVKIYSPLFPTNYMISSVNNAVNSTFFTINNPVTNNDIIGSGFLVDSITFKHQAFKNSLNQNVVRYYNTNMNYYDSYDSVALKIVFLSATTAIVPKVYSLRAICVSA